MKIKNPYGISLERILCVRACVRACVCVGESSAELEIAPDIGDSACHILNALLRLCYHDLIIVDNLRLEA